MLNTYTWLSRADSGFVGPEANKNLGSSVRERIQNYEYKIRYGYEYLFIAKKRPQQITHLKKLTNSTNITKIRKIT
jgi:hypothetical protein